MMPTYIILCTVLQLNSAIIMFIYFVYLWFVFLVMGGAIFSCFKIVAQRKQSGNCFLMYHEMHAGLLVRYTTFANVCVSIPSVNKYDWPRSKDLCRDYGADYGELAWSLVPWAVIILSGEYCKILPTVYLCWFAGAENFLPSGPKKKLHYYFGPDGRKHFQLQQTSIDAHWV